MSVIAHGRRIIDFAAQHLILTIYASPGLPEQGGLMEYSASLREVLVRAAGYVNRILRGAKPADLPIEQPTKFEFIINLKTAMALGLTIPPSLLARADQVLG
jgi:ABC-type uncharacterized transport system substrate-binding protein